MCACPNQTVSPHECMGHDLMINGRTSASFRTASSQEPKDLSNEHRHSSVLLLWGVSGSTGLPRYYDESIERIVDGASQSFKPHLAEPFLLDNNINVSLKLYAENSRSIAFLDIRRHHHHYQAGLQG